jgi:dihydrofolate reductase
MKSHWTTSASSEDDPKIIDFMNETHKIVFSKSLEKADWNNSELAREFNAEEIAKLKGKSGKNILILGSGSLVSQFANADLIDEYQFLVNLVVLGSGKTLFQSIGDTVKLKHSSTKTFSNGNVLVCYQPDN